VKNATEERWSANGVHTHTPIDWLHTNNNNNNPSSSAFFPHLLLHPPNKQPPKKDFLTLKLPGSSDSEETEYSCCNCCNCFIVASFTTSTNRPQ
jgi:hypothetical protein